MRSSYYSISNDTQDLSMLLSLLIQHLQSFYYHQISQIWMHVYLLDYTRLNKFIFDSTKNKICIKRYWYFLQLFSVILQYVIYIVNKQNKINPIKQINMQYQRTYLNSCELQLQSLHINLLNKSISNHDEGNMHYFLWMKGKRHTQSKNFKLRLNADTKKCKQIYLALNERLQMNLKLYAKYDQNTGQEIFQPKNTHLYLMSDRNQIQVCSFLLNVQKWRQKSNRVQLQIISPIITGRLVAIMRRTPIMQLNNFQKFSQQLQQSEDQQQFQNNSAFFGNKPSGQLICIKKQLQDANYMLQKLKKDCNTTLARNQILQFEIKTIKTNIKQQFKRMQGHYCQKIQYRQAIYREQIQQLINLFNQNYEINHRISKSIIQQNQNLQMQLANLKLVHEQQTKDHELLYETKIQEYQDNIMDFQAKIVDLQNAYDQQKQTIEHLSNLLNTQKQQYNNYSNETQQKQKQYTITINQFVQKIEVLNEQVRQYKQQIEQKQKISTQKQLVLKGDQQKITQLSNLIKSHQKTISDEMKQKYQLRNQLQKIKVQVQSLKIQNQQLKIEIQKLRQQNKGEIQKNQAKDKYIQDKEAEVMKLYQQQNQKAMKLLQQQHDLELNIHQLQSNIVIKQEQNNYLVSDVQRLKQLKQSLQNNLKDMAEAYDEDAHKLTTRLQQLQTQNNDLKIQNQGFQIQLNDIQQRQNMQINQIKIQFDQLKAIRQQQFQNQLNSLKEHYDEQQLASTIKNQQLEHENDLFQEQMYKIQNNIGLITIDNQNTAQQLKGARIQVLHNIQQINALKQLLQHKDQYYQQIVQKIRDGYAKGIQDPHHFPAIQLNLTNIRSLNKDNAQQLLKTDSSSYLRQIQRLKKELQKQKNINIVEHEKIQKQWEQLRKIHGELATEQEKLRLKHERLDVFQLEQNGNNFNGTQSYLALPSTNTRQTEPQLPNIIQQASPMIKQSIKLGIPLQYLQKLQQKPDIITEIPQIKKQHQQFQDQMLKFTKQLHSMNAGNQQETINKFKQMYQARIDQLERHILELEQLRKEDQIKYRQQQYQQKIEQLEQQLNDAEERILKFAENEQQMLSKFQDYQAYIDNLQAKIMEGNQESSNGNRQFDNLNQSKIQVRVAKQQSSQYERINSDRQLQGSLVSLLKRKPTIEKLGIGSSHKSVQESKLNLKVQPKKIMENQYVQTQDVQEISQKKNQQISFNNNYRLTSNGQTPQQVSESELKMTQTKLMQSVVQKRLQALTLNKQPSKSHIQISNSQTIKDIQSQNNAKVAKLQTQLYQLNRQNDRLKNDINQLKNQNSLTRKDYHELKKDYHRQNNTEKQLVQQLLDTENNLKNKNQQIYLQNQSITQLKLRNQQLYDQLILLKKQIHLKSQMKQSQILQYQQKQQQAKKNQIVYDNKIHLIKSQLQKKQDRYKETIQQMKMQLQSQRHQKQLNISQSKRMRNQIQDLRGKTSANFNNSNNHHQPNFNLVKTLQQQLDDANKKLVENTRIMNKLRIQKQTAQDQLIILKNKNKEISKNNHNIQNQINNLHKQNDEISHKYHRIRREKQYNEEQLVKIKENNKKYEEEMRNMGSYSNNYYNQRKQNLEKKLELEESMAQKDVEIRKITKQLTNLKQTLQQLQNTDSTTKSTKQTQRNFLQSQLAKQTKTNQQNTNQIIQLTRQIQSIQQKHKAQIQQLNKSYAQKLKFYVHEINNINIVLTQSQTQMQNLRIQNTSLLEQIDYINKQIQECNNRNIQVVQYSKQLEQMIQNEKEQKLTMMKESKKLGIECIQLQNQLVECKSKFEKQQLVFNKKFGKIQQIQIINDKYIYQIKKLKQKLTKSQQLLNQQSKHIKDTQQLQSDNQLLLGQLTAIKQQHHIYKTHYQYTQKQVEQLLTQMQDTLKTNNNDQIQKLTNNIKDTYQQKTIDRQQQLLRLYNQNIQHGIILQQKQQQYMIILQKFKQIQGYPNKYQSLENQMEILKDQLKIKLNQILYYEKETYNFQLTVKQLQRRISQQMHQYNLKQSQCKNIGEENSKLQYQKMQLETLSDMLKNQLDILKNSQANNQQSSSTLQQRLEGKLLSLQLQNQRIKQREQNISKQYKNKVDSLQNSLKNMKKQSKEIEKVLTKKIQIQKVENKKNIENLINQNQQSVQEIRSITNKFTKLDEQNLQLRVQLSNLREQMSEDEQLYIMQINNLKNTINDMQQLYNSNVTSLEEQLAILNRDLTQIKLNKNQLLKQSRLRDSHADNRYDERIKIKQQKIQEQKQQIFTLQQKLSAMKTPDDTNNSFQLHSNRRYKDLYFQSHKKLQELVNCKEQQLLRHNQNLKSIRKQLNKQKQKGEEISLEGEQLKLRNQSLQTELHTLKLLYRTLQEQIDKRRNKLIGDQQGQYQIIERQLVIKTKRVNQLQQEMIDMKIKLDQQTIHIQNKDKQLQHTHQQLNKKKIQNIKLHSINQQHSTNNNTTTKTNQLLHKIQQLQKQNRKLNLQIKNSNQQLFNKNQQLIALKQDNQNMQYQRKIGKHQLSIFQENINKYKIIQKKCQESYGNSIEQLILGGVLFQKLVDKQNQLKITQQQLEQFRFVENQRIMDYQQLQRKNFQLQLKLQDYDDTSLQLQHLRKITDKIQQEKKNAIFRQEAIRIRLSNLVGNGNANGSMRQSISAILDYDAYI